jgi:hypothetical protein
MGLLKRQSYRSGERLRHPKAKGSGRATIFVGHSRQPRKGLTAQK